jgi:hypothetical protein
LTEEFQAELDRLIPADDSKPLQGRYFADWEDQADEVIYKISTAFLEERSRLDDTARHEHAGGCPRCGSMRTYLLKYQRKSGLLSRHGEVTAERQTALCRDCGQSFSPSGA